MVSRLDQEINNLRGIAQSHKHPKEKRLLAYLEMLELAKFSPDRQQNIINCMRNLINDRS